MSVKSYLDFFCYNDIYQLSKIKRLLENYYICEDLIQRYSVLRQIIKLNIKRLPNI